MNEVLYCVIWSNYYLVVSQRKYPGTLIEQNRWCHVIAAKWHRGGSVVIVAGAQNNFTDVN